MPNRYAITLTDPQAVPLATIHDYISLDYILAENEWTPAVLQLPGHYDAGLFREDGRLYIARAVGDGPLYVDGEACWFIRKVREFTTAGGEDGYELRALHANYLLDSRIVAYAAGSSQADKGKSADDASKDIVRENLGSSATDTARRISSSYFQVAADVSAAATINKAFSRRIVLEVLQDLAAMSAQVGTWLGFDVVLVNAETGLLEFRTYTQQRGLDHRFPDGTPPILLGTGYGNLSAPSLERDYTEEITYVYAGGQGQGTARDIATASDATAIGASPFNRRERFRHATHVGFGNTSSLTDEAEAELRLRRARVLFTGEIVEGGGVTYGLDYRYGDRVTATYKRATYDCRVNRVHVRVQGGKETVNASIRYDGV